MVVEAVRQKTGPRKRVVPGSSTAAPFILYIGDDETDEDAFAALRDDGVGVHVHVGEGISQSLADYAVGDPDQVLLLLHRLYEQGDGYDLVES